MEFGEEMKSLEALKGLLVFLHWKYLVPRDLTKLALIAAYQIGVCDQQKKHLEELQGSNSVAKG